MEKSLTQHEIKTKYILHGERIYYIDATDTADAQKRWEAQHHHDNLVKDSILMIEEHVKESNPVDIEIDVEGLRRAERSLEAEAWNRHMNDTIKKSKEKLRREMGYGEKD